MQDPNIPLFTYADPQTSTLKMKHMSALMIRGANSSKFTERDQTFINKGIGNVIFTETCVGDYVGAMNNIELVITFYDLLKSGKRLKQMKFIYISCNEKLFDDEIWNDFYTKELEKRNIEIIYNEEVTKVTFDFFLEFKSGKRLEFNYCHMVPKFDIPHYIKYSELCGIKRSNIFVFGDQVSQKDTKTEIVLTI